MELEDAVVNAQAREGYALADGGTLEIRQGSMVLAVLGFGSPAFGAPQGGTVDARPLAPETAAPETGTADNYVARDAQGARLWSGSVGVTGSGADMQFPSTAIQKGSRVEMDSGPVMTVRKHK